MTTSVDNSRFLSNIFLSPLSRFFLVEYVALPGCQWWQKTLWVYQQDDLCLTFHILKATG
jgi:hypothetical protein